MAAGGWPVRFRAHLVVFADGGRRTRRKIDPFGRLNRANHGGGRPLRTLIAWTLTLALGTSAWAQQQAPATKKANAPANAKPAAAPVDPKAQKAMLDADLVLKKAEMEKVLSEWEVRSKKIVSLEVLFDRIDRSPGWGDQYYQGRAMLQSPDLALLQFQKYKIDANGKKVVAKKDGKLVPQLEPEPFERIVCTGTKVLQYSWDDKKIFIFPLDKEARQKALQQGPLPFLFNMKAADAKKRYSMTLLNQDEKDYLIGIVPNEEIDKDSFSKAFLWLNKKSFLPDQLWLYTVGNKERQEFVFAGELNTIRANTPLDQKFFLDARFPGWKAIENPNGNGAPAQGKVVVPPGQPPRRQATQPAGRPQ
jgi:TIGR03009 family protein